MANDADVQDIKDKVENIDENIVSIKDKGVKINPNNFNRLSAIVNMETSLGEVSENTHHINDNLGKSGAIYEVLDKIREQATGIKDFFGTSNQHIDSTSTGATITNASGSTQSLGGFSDTVNKIYDEIKTFREEVISTLENKDIVSNGAQDKGDKTDPNYWKEKKNKEKEEDRAKRRGERTTGGIVTSVVGGLTNALTGIAKGITFDQLSTNVTSTLKSSNVPVVKGAGIVLDGLKALFDLYAKQDKEASEYARTIGGGKFGKNQIIQVANRAVATAPARYGLNQTDIIGQAKELADVLGRSVSDLSSQSLVSAAILKKMGIGSEVLGNFDTFGRYVQQTDKYFTDLYSKVSRRGLSFRNVSKAVNDNLKAAQSYSFANGLKGLEAMAEKSTQLKFNMQQTMNFANTVSTFEGAIKTAADLSVLGGSFGRYANPMQMMYEGLNDVEALQNRMINMFGEMATYDTERKQMRINPQNLQFIKSAATAAGLDPNEMASLALNQGKFNHIRSEIKANFDEDTLEYIKNLAELDENGHGFITVNGQNKALSELTEKDAAAIKNESERKAEKNAATMGDIFVNTKSISETLDDMLKYLQTKLGMWVAKLAGVKFDSAGSRGYWRNLTSEEKQELIAKYGGRYQAKLAVGMGEETETVNNALGRNDYEGSIVREFLNDKAGKELTWRKSKNIYSKNLYNNWLNGEYDNEFKEWAAEHNYNISNQQTNSGSNQIIRNVEPSVANAQNNGFTLSNVNENTFEPMTVNPTRTVGPEKVEFEPFDVTVNIGGKIDLSSGDKTKTIDVTKLSQTDLDKLTAMIYKQVYTEISKRIEHGFNKEGYPFRGA